MNLLFMAENFFSGLYANDQWRLTITNESFRMDETKVKTLRDAYAHSPFQSPCLLQYSLIISPGFLET